MDGSRSNRRDRDMSPAGRVRATGIGRERVCYLLLALTVCLKCGYGKLMHAWFAQNGGYSVARSQSAAGVARPQRARSKSPRRSLSPPADRDWRYTGAALGAPGLRLPIRRRSIVSAFPVCDRSADDGTAAGLDPARNTIVELSKHARSLASAHYHFTATTVYLPCSVPLLFFPSRIFLRPPPSLPTSTLSTLVIVVASAPSLRC